MDVSLEPLIVGLFAVLPGFVSAAVRAAIAPGVRASTGEWVAGSVVGSLFLNVLALSGFLPMGPFDLEQPVGTVGVPLGKVPVRLALLYLLVLYALAVAWGVISGLLTNYAPRALTHRLRLTPVSPARNVFNDSIERLVRTAANRMLQGDPSQQVPWLRVQRDQTGIVGRLRRGSVDFDVDKPIEVFLSPAFPISVTDLIPWPPLVGARHEGVYVRLISSDIVEVFTARADWLPRPTETGPPPHSP